jgi:acyl-CoA reductase-like NAD-dependent aldehyde dehydrogenase
MLLIPFDEEDDAARIANSIPFGLGSSIHCSDMYDLLIIDIQWKETSHGLNRT